MMSIIAGSKWTIPVVLVLVVGLIVFGLIQYGGNIESERNQVERLEQEVETRERIDEAIRNTPTDTDGARRLLNEFLQSRD